jgi:RNA polymerase sigma-70 factor (ECF subfamily)
VKKPELIDVNHAVVNTTAEPESDDRLMERAAQNDRAAFDVLVRRHQHRLQRFSSRMLGGDSSRGADVAVGALLRLWECRNLYRPAGKLESWLLKTAYRQCLDILAGGRSDGDIDDFADDGANAPHEQVERELMAEAVRGAVMQLPRAHRAVIVLAVYEGMSYEAVADALDIPIGTVASRKNNALAKMRQKLAAWSPAL